MQVVRPHTEKGLVSPQNSFDPALVERSRLRDRPECRAPVRWSSQSRPGDVRVCRPRTLVELVETSRRACVSPPHAGRASRDLATCVCVAPVRWSSQSGPRDVRVCRPRTLVELVETWCPGECGRCVPQRVSVGACPSAGSARGLYKLDQHGGRGARLPAGGVGPRSDGNDPARDPRGPCRVTRRRPGRRNSPQPCADGTHRCGATG